MTQRTLIAPTPLAAGLHAGTVGLLLFPIVPKMTTPKIAPLTMEPWIVDGEQQVDDNGHPCWIGRHPDYPSGEKWFSCDYGVGDTVAVKETWLSRPDLDDELGGMEVLYRATDNVDASLYGGWKSPVTMPQWAVRTRLTVTSIACSRAVDLTDDQICRVLGAPLQWPGPGPEPYTRNLKWCMEHFWTRLHGPEAMRLWVWSVGVVKQS